MSSDDHDAIGQMLARWTVGGVAAPVAPAGWTTEAEGAELRLVALAGHFLDVGVVAMPAGALRTRPDLPRLVCPTVPDAIRPLVRRCLAQARESAARGDLLRLLARRGWSAHPGDWMPGAGETDVPDLYAPWRDWAADGVTVGPGELTAESWAAWGPAARRVAFAEFRRRDSAAARDLLASRLTGLPADERVRLIELLATGLSDADAPLLDSLASDRAPRVKALAAQLLARLGRGGAGGEDAVELAGFFSIATRGLLRRTRVLEPRALKTQAQFNRRAALLASVDLSSFAGALGLAPAELVALWPWGEDGSPDLFLAGAVERSGGDEAVAAALAGALRAAPDALALLAPRLSPIDLVRAAERLLDAEPSGLHGALDLTRARFDLESAPEAPAARALFAALARPDEVRNSHEAELRMLGLLAGPAAARRSLDRAVAAGLAAADPRLDTLRLNVALIPSTGAPDDR